MTARESKGRPSKVTWALFMVAILSLFITFMGIKFEDVSSSISSALFPKPDYAIESVDGTSFLSSDFLRSLTVSEEHYVITSVGLKSRKVYQGDLLQFSISFENKGKNPVKQPRIVIYFTDCVYRVWGVWNQSATNGIFEKGCSLEYNFPPLDQKIVSSWLVLALLYDDAKDVLVSYEIEQFTVTDVAPEPWWYDLAVIVAAAAAFIAGIYMAYHQDKIFHGLRRLLRMPKKE